MPNFIFEFLPIIIVILTFLVFCGGVVLVCYVIGSLHVSEMEYQRKYPKEIWETWSE